MLHELHAQGVSISALPDKRDWTGRRSGVTWPRGSSHRCTDRERRKARYWAGILLICKPGLTSIRIIRCAAFAGDTSTGVHGRIHDPDRLPAHHPATAGGRL